MSAPADGRAFDSRYLWGAKTPSRRDGLVNDTAEAVAPQKARCLVVPR